MGDFYILDKNKQAVKTDLNTWLKMFENTDRSVGKLIIGKVKISTVFLGLDHSFGGRRPLLFETMVFGGKFDGYQRRCSTWKEAEDMHKETCIMVVSREK